MDAEYPQQIGDPTTITQEELELLPVEAKAALDDWCCERVKRWTRIVEDARHQLAAWQKAEAIVAESVARASLTPKTGHKAVLHQAKREELERVLDVLRACGWNRNLAAEKLGCTRRTLYERVLEARRLGYQIHKYDQAHKFRLVGKGA